MQIDAVHAFVVCPRCKGPLAPLPAALECRPCALRYPLAGRVPILIDDERSVFRRADFAAGDGVVWDSTWKRPGLGRRWLDALIPEKSLHIARFAAGDAIAHVCAALPQARVLVLGCGARAHGVPAGARIIHSDVSLGPSVDAVFDAHDIPFPDGYFDLVIAEAVLEHVADPARCVAEIGRVLQPRGWIYAVTPFMQQVHMAGYDFTRFTPVGHRRLLRDFDELESGMANGPGTALAWAVEYFLSSFADGRRARRLLKLAARFIAAPFVQCDRLLVRRKGALDGASALYFFGIRRATPLSDREVIATYGGLNSV